MVSSSLTHDEEVRVIALDFASKLMDYGNLPMEAKLLVEKSEVIEKYIRDVKDNA